jgi:hypothetical protein
VSGTGRPKSPGNFPESDDNVRREEKAREKSEDIEGRMIRMNEGKGWRSYEEAEEIATNEVRNVMYLWLHMQPEYGINHRLSPRTESSAQLCCSEIIVIDMANTDAPFPEGDSITNFNEWEVSGPSRRSNAQEKRIHDNERGSERGEDITRGREGQQEKCMKSNWWDETQTLHQSTLECRSLIMKFPRIWTLLLEFYETFPGILLRTGSMAI